MLCCQELSNREDAQHESRLLVAQVPRLWLGAFDGLRPRHVQFTCSVVLTTWAPLLSIWTSPAQLRGSSLASGWGITFALL